MNAFCASENLDAFIALRSSQGNHRGKTLTKNGPVSWSQSTSYNAVAFNVAMSSAGDDAPLVGLVRTERDVRQFWAALTEEDLLQGRRAMRALAGAPRLTVPFLREHLRPAPSVDPTPGAAGSGASALVVVALKVGWCQYASVHCWWLLARSAASQWVSWLSRPPSVVEQSLLNGSELHSMFSETMCQSPRL